MGRLELLILFVHIQSVVISPGIHGRSLSGENIKLQETGDPGVAVVPEQKSLDPDDYLERYGYLVPFKTDTGERPAYSEDTRQQAIKDFQKFFNLEVTGTLNDETITTMSQPRCGVPDIRPARDPTQPQEFNTVSNWPSTSIRWRVQKYSDKLPEETQRTAFENAFNHWASASGLTIQKTNTTTADIVLRFESGYHGDGIKNAFDGQGGVLAHAFEPQDGSAHFDADERWVYHSNNGTDLETVATHEFGHSLGLAHSLVRGSAMYPLSSPYREDFSLHADDIAGIQSLYGLPKTTTTTPKPKQSGKNKNNNKKRRKKKKEKKSKPDLPPNSNNTALCGMKFDAITRGPDDHIHLFIGKHLYKLLDYCLEGHSCVMDGYPVPIRKVYKRGPKKVTAAAYVPDNRKRTYLFKGKKVWRYTKYKLDKGYPKIFNSSVLPYKPSAAYIQKNQFADYQLYMFGSKYFWELSLYTEMMSNGKMLVDTYWDHVPKKPDAIFQMRDGSIYIFKGKYYRKYDHLRDEVQRKRRIAPAWIGGSCGFSER